jgi:hypothetical protein
MTASNSGTEYDQWLDKIRRRVSLIGETPLFVVDVDRHKLWEAYLDGFKDPARRQHHNCCACHHFIGRFGGIVTLTGSRQDSLFWILNETPEEYRPSIANVLELMRGARVRTVLRSASAQLGTECDSDKKGNTWTHFACRLPSTSPALNWNNKATRTAKQAMSADRKNHTNLMLALRDFDAALIDRAVELLSNEAAYRGGDVLGPAKFLQSLHAATVSSISRSDAIWDALATAPEGFCHPRSSMIGTVLEDLKEGRSAHVVLERFAQKMEPQNYQRPTAAPTTGSIKRAEQLVQQLGIARSLERRFAKLDEVLTKAIWAPSEEPAPATMPSGVFGHLTPKGETQTAAELDLPSVTMTWAKFARDVLPNVVSLEAHGSSDRHVALITSVHSYAQPILTWDSRMDRNPFSWSYASGADGEIRRRVLAAGGKIEGCDIRVSLLWNNFNDLDLHCVTPTRSHIYFGSKRHDNGWLDVDMNVKGETDEPVENIRWESGHALSGNYRFFVENFAYHQSQHLDTPFTVQVEVNGTVKQFSGVIPSYRTDAASRVEVAAFLYRNRTDIPEIKSSCKEDRSTSTKGFAKVRAIVPSPNVWGVSPGGTAHILFLLDGYRASEIGGIQGMLPEHLRPELREVRSVLAAHAGSATISPSGGDDACGLGYNTSTGWGLVLRARMKSGTTANYLIDRFE